MRKVIDWSKSHPLVLVLSFVVILLLAKQATGSFSSYSRSSYNYAPQMASMDEMSGMMAQKSGAGVSNSYAPVPPYSRESTDLYQTDRKVVTDSTLSLLVKNVQEATNQIIQRTSQEGGFMVSSTVQTPSEGGNGTLSIRVPSEKTNAMLDYLRGMSVKVISENISGYDVTDQYSDSQARLETLTKTKVTFEGMLERANTVDEILKVQQSILNVQDQIDAVKGRLQYLENTSKSSLITVYLSTDELALPYSPNQSWRPAVVFKTAVRSLIGNLRAVGNLAIWAAVYSPVIIGIGILLLIAKRKLSK